MSLNTILWALGGLVVLDAAIAFVVIKLIVSDLKKQAEEEQAKIDKKNAEQNVVGIVSTNPVSASTVSTITMGTGELKTKRILDTYA